MMDFPLDGLMDEQACYDRLVALLHPDGLACPRCGGTDAAWIFQATGIPLVHFSPGESRFVIAANERLNLDAYMASIEAFLAGQGLIKTRVDWSKAYDWSALARLDKKLVP